MGTQGCQGGAGPGAGSVGSQTGAGSRTGVDCMGSQTGAGSGAESFSVCGASGIRSLKGGLCHGPAGVPRLATRCLCVLSTWLVVCLVPCAPMSIVCPLPSCYLIIVSVAPAVSPSLPSFVSLYSLLVSAVLCWSVVFHVSYVMWVSCWL